MAKINETDIQTAVKWIKEADAIWLGAGSGLTSAAGPAFDYSNEEFFAQHYPGLVKQGFSRKIELMGALNLPPEMFWGYYAQNIKEVRFSPDGHEVYQKLLDIVSIKKDFFVITTNVDRLFTRNGFPDDRIYTPQGDYGFLQCMDQKLDICKKEVWESKEIIEHIVDNTNPETQMTSSEAIPKCPYCGGRVFINARGADWFVHEPYEGQLAGYKQWLKHALTKKLLVLDIGSGFNTPVWVRYPAEQITYQYEKTRLIRINLGHPQIPHEIKNRSISFANDALEIIRELWKELKKKLGPE